MNNRNELKKAHQWIADAFDAAGIVEPMFFVRWNGRLSRTLARAHVGTGEIDIGPKAWAVMSDADRRELCFHEAAHLICTAGAGHGREWLDLMASFGYTTAGPYMASAADALPGPKRVRFIYGCACAPACFALTAARHRKHNRTGAFSCRECSQKLVWNGDKKDISI